MGEYTRRLKKLARPLVQKPWQSPTMEFQHGLWTGVSALFSESGRQLGEENARPLMFNEHIKAETQICKFDGSRFGHEINISALRIAMRHFKEAIEINCSVRDFHLSKIGKPLNAQPGIWDLYIISRASVALIGYRARSNALSVSECVPDVLASQYQFVSGVFMICRDMMAQHHPAIQSNQTIDAADLYKYADENGIFRSPNDMVCAGSTQKILEFLRALIAGAQKSLGTRLDAGHLGIAKLKDYVVDLDLWYAYAISCVEFDCFIEQEILRRNSDAGGISKPSSASGAVYEALRSYCCCLLPSLKDLPELEFDEAALIRQNLILEFLGRPKIGAISKGQISKRLG